MYIPAHRPARPRRALVLLSGLLTAVTLAPAAHGTGQPEPRAAGGIPASIGVRLIPTDRTPAGDERARVYIVEHVHPGDVLEREIDVINASPVTRSLAVYPAAASVDGGAFVVPAGRASNELSRWTSVDRGTVTLPPWSDERIRVTTKVPPDAAEGERYGVVWAEYAGAPDAAGVTLVNRVGVRMYVSVGPGGPPPADFTIHSMSARRDDNDVPIVTATVENTGGRALDLTGTLRLKDGPGGTTAGPYRVSLGTTLEPGGTATVVVPLAAGLPDGPWKAVITLESGLLARTGEATLKLDEPGEVRVSPVGGWTATLGTLGGILLALGLLAGLGIRRRRRRRRGSAAGGGSDSPDASDTSAAPNTSNISDTFSTSDTSDTSDAPDGPDGPGAADHSAAPRS